MSEKIDTKILLESHLNSPEFQHHLSSLAHKKNDYTFPITSISQVEEDVLKPVYDAFQDLSTSIGGLNTKIGLIVKKQSEDFVSAYKYEMHLIQKDLKDIKKKYEEFMLRANKSNVIENLEKQLNFFRDEAWKLKDHMEKKDKEIHALRSKMSLLEDERKFLSEYIMRNVKENKLIKLGDFGNPKKPEKPKKPNENLNRSFIVEKKQNWALLNKSDLFSNTQIEGADVQSICFETGLEKLDDFLNYIKQRDFNDKLGLLVDIEAFYKDIVNHYEFKLKDVYAKFAKEKAKLQAGLSMKAIEKNEVVDFFQECVEKVRANISRRKALSQNLNVPFDKKKKKLGEDATKITNNDFLAADRQFILELFLTNEKVLGTVQQMLTTSLEKRETRATSAMDVSQHLRGLESDTDPSILTSALGDTHKAFYGRGHGPVSDSNSLKFPHLVEESLQLKSRTVTSDFNAYDVNTKFGQIFGRDGTPTYKPRTASTIKDVTESYKFQIQKIIL